MKKLKITMMIKMIKMAMEAEEASEEAQAQELPVTKIKVENLNSNKNNNKFNQKNKLVVFVEDLTKSSMMNLSIFTTGKNVQCLYNAGNAVKSQKYQL